MRNLQQIHNSFRPSEHLFNANIRTVVDQFATKEGVPSGFDGAINNEVNKEINNL